MEQPLQMEQHARIVGSPGRQPLLAGLFRVVFPLLLAVGATGYLLRAAWPRPALTPAAVGFLLLLLAAALAAVVPFSRRRLQAFMKGARGEEWVARLLAFLPAGFTVYHGLRPPDAEGLPAGADLDHVVVGPNGVSLVETKHWSGRIGVEDGRILVNGTVPQRPPLEQVMASAGTLREALRRACGAPVEVQPIVCFAAGAVSGEPVGVSGVIVCRDRVLLDAVRREREATLEPALRGKVEAFLDTLLAAEGTREP